MGNPERWKCGVFDRFVYRNAFFLRLECKTWKIYGLDCSFERCKIVIPERFENRMRFAKVSYALFKPFKDENAVFYGPESNFTFLGIFC